MFGSTTTLLTDKLITWYESAIFNLPNLFIATLILVIFIYLSSQSRRLALKVTHTLSSRKQLNQLISMLISLIFIFLGTLLALQVLGLSHAVTSMLAGAGILGLVLGFALQEVASNFISGIILTLQEPFRIGNLIKTNDYFGTVYQVDLDSTQLKLLDGQLVDIPNKDILLNPLVNYTTFHTRRITLKAGVAYDSNLQQVKKITLRTIQMLDHDPIRDIEFYFTEFADSAVSFKVRFWIPFNNTQKDYFQAKSQAIISLKQAFDKEGINIPYPTSTIIQADSQSK